MNKKTIVHTVHTKFIESVAKWLGEADDGLIQRFCMILVINNPVLAQKIVDLIQFSFKRKKQDNVQ
jgi:hypothetical protein